MSTVTHSEVEKILIIGGVAAGATAAARARRINGKAEITILEAGDDVSFANCGLPYYIGGDIANRSDLILASPETFRDQYRVAVHTGTEAQSIDRENRKVVAWKRDSHQEVIFEYDRLILAQGGKPIVPPLPGVEQDNVFQLWTLEDMDGINSFIENNEPKTAVVVGGGFIGLEMVEALAKRGMKVSLVEMAPQIMPNLEGEFAGFLTKELLDYGIDVKLGTSMQGIEGKSMQLSDGSSIEADLVLLSVGVRPTLKLAQEAGLEMGQAGGLLVDERLQTSDGNIYAAGDMCEIRNSIHGRQVRIPLAGPANRQGRMAAENALGGNRTYRGASGTSVVKVFGAVCRLGRPEPKGRQGCRHRCRRRGGSQGQPYGLLSRLGKGQPHAGLRERKRKGPGSPGRRPGGRGQAPGCHRHSHRRRSDHRRPGRTRSGLRSTVQQPQRSREHGGLHR
jgi:NADPH-dependent 2,4-dienoyl-CoA reductase/sulfur reductase-like enzyme